MTEDSTRPNEASVASPPTLVLPQRVDITHAAELRERMLELLGSTGSIRVDAGGVDRVDTAGIQLLTALALEARRGDGSLLWVSVSDAVREAARVLEATEVLALEGH